MLLLLLLLLLPRLLPPRPWCMPPCAAEYASARHSRGCASACPPQHLPAPAAAPLLYAAAAHEQMAIMQEQAGRKQAGSRRRRRRTLAPSAGPTGGAGLALPAASASLIMPVTAGCGAGVGSPHKRAQGPCKARRTPECHTLASPASPSASPRTLSRHGGHPPLLRRAAAPGGHLGESGLLLAAANEAAPQGGAAAALGGHRPHRCRWERPHRALHICRSRCCCLLAPPAAM